MVVDQVGLGLLRCCVRISFVKAWDPVGFGFRAVVRVRLSGLWLAAATGGIKKTGRSLGFLLLRLGSKKVGEVRRTNRGERLNWLWGVGPRRWSSFTLILIWYVTCYLTSTKV